MISWHGIVWPVWCVSYLSCARIVTRFSVGREKNLQYGLKSSWLRQFLSAILTSNTTSMALWCVFSCRSMAAVERRYEIVSKPVFKGQTTFAAESYCSAPFRQSLIRLNTPIQLVAVAIKALCRCRDANNNNFREFSFWLHHFHRSIRGTFPLSFN